MARRINAPGFEVNEIDRSSYDQTVDNSTVGTASLVLGFADKGEDYIVKWINTMTTFNNTYGTPTTDAEKYFYNAVYEIINGGGSCYAAKLPYYNDSFENFVYTSYTISPQATYLSSAIDMAKNTFVKSGRNLISSLFYPGICQTSDEKLKKLNIRAVYDFESYIISQANLDISQQDALDVILSGASEDETKLKRNKFTQYLSAIMEYTGVDNSGLLKDFNTLSSTLSSIRDKIAYTFSTNQVNDIVESFVKTLYLYQLSDYYDDVKTDSNLQVNNTDKFSTKYTEIKTVDDSLMTYTTISSDISAKNEIMSFENYDKFLIKQLKVPQNKIYIVDITRGKYEKDTFGNEIIGIMPVIVSPANALFYQEIIKKNDAILQDYNVISKIRNSYRIKYGEPFEETIVPVDQTFNSVDKYDGKTNNFVGIGDYLGTEEYVTINDYTVSQYAAQHFPTLSFVNGRLDRQYLNKIGIVVFKVYKDTANNNKISFIPVEAFIGSLDRYTRDESTNEIVFIDDVVNNGSDYINVFSNANIPEYKETQPLALKNTSIFVVNNQTACSMGFYERDTEKDIHVSKSIYQPMLKIFERSEDKNTLDIDLIVDAGTSNIAQFIASTCLESNPRDEFQRYGKYDLGSDQAYLFKLENQSQTNVWKKILQRYDEFTKNVRKDCLFLADGPRPFCIEGNSKIIRRSKPENTIKKSILPKMKLISNVLNSSYSTGYLNWFWSLDNSTGEYMWMPPSIKALGVYLYTDKYGAYWDAPAGLNRGKISNTLDIAFNPTNEEAGQIYINSWNYAISYPLDGIVLEGQKTFQRNKTALDRCNVRRLMLGLEKTIRGFLKYFNYEGNTSFQRTRIKDTIDRYLEQVKVNDGINQYICICDDRNNTTETIENNELHIFIAVRPIKTIEYICLNFMAVNQSVDVTEIVESEFGS